MAQTVWEPNEVQKAFLGALADGKVRSLKQVNAMLGREIKPGSINTLINKGKVKSLMDAVEYATTIKETRTYADGTVVEIEKTKTATETGYQLVWEGLDPSPSKEGKTADGKII